MNTTDGSCYCCASQHQPGWVSGGVHLHACITLDCPAALRVSHARARHCDLHIQCCRRLGPTTMHAQPEPCSIMPLATLCNDQLLRPFLPFFAFFCFFFLLPPCLLPPCDSTRSPPPSGAAAAPCLGEESSASLLPSSSLLLVCSAS